MKRFAICALFAVAHMAGAVDDEPAPKGYWNVRDARAILDRTGTIRLAASLDGLSAPERDAVTHLLAAGAIVQRVYESSLHAQALAAHAQLERLDAERGHPESTRALLDLYRLFQGPIARTLANERVPFLPVTPEDPGRNVYPDEITKDEADAWLSAQPQDRAALLGDRTVVRRATADNLHADLGAMSRQPVLDALHPGLHAKLEALLATPDPHTLYALPYSLAYADELAYIRHRGSDTVMMIPLKAVGEPGKPVPVVDFPGGQHPPGRLPRPTPAAGIVQAPGESAVLVANPEDQIIYYYKEGMAAPMGHFQNYGKQPLAALVVDRSLREVRPGVYETTVKMAGAGNYEQYWENLCNGLSSISEVPGNRWDKDAFYSTDVRDKNKSISKWGGFVDGVEFFDADFFGVSAQVMRQLSMPSSLWNSAGRLPSMAMVKSPSISL